MLSDKDKKKDKEKDKEKKKDKEDKKDKKSKHEKDKDKKDIKAAIGASFSLARQSMLACVYSYINGAVFTIMQRMMHTLQELIGAAKVWTFWLLMHL